MFFGNVSDISTSSLKANGIISHFIVLSDLPSYVYKVHFFYI